MAKEWSIKNLYFYLVCLVTLFLIVGGAIAGINSATQLALPDKPNVPIYNLYYPEPRADSSQQAFEPPPLEELERRRAEQEQMDQYHRGFTKRSLLNSIALILIATPFYIYHWKQVKPSVKKRGERDEG